MKKLQKSQEDRWLFGVCGGLGEYFSIDPVIIRLIAVATGFLGFGLVGYLVAALIMPGQEGGN
jgi:phage shock protein C